MNHFEKYLFDQYPEISEIKRSIDDFLDLDLSSISYEDLKRKLDREFPIIAFGECSLDGGKSIFRARRNFNNEFLEPYNDIIDLGIPPQNKTPFGRANIENKPIFYGSSFGELTLFESCQNLQLHEKFMPQNFTVIEWQVKENHTLKLVPLYNSENYTISRNDIIKALTKKKNIYDKHFTCDKIKMGEHLISNFFANQFAKSDIKSVDDYKFSAYFAEFIKNSNFKSPIKFDGVLYPSVAYKYKNDNVARFPESLFKIKPIKAFSVTTYNFDFENGTCVSAALQEGRFYRDGKITWCNL